MADCTPDSDARAQPTAPAAGALVGPVTGTLGHSSGGVGADHAPAQAAGTAADGEPVTAADCAPAPAVECAPAVVADGAPVAAADCAPTLALDRARVAIGVSRPAQPSVDSAIATVAAAYGTMNANQRQSVGTILRALLVAEKPSALRARAGNGRDLLYTRETVPLNAVVGRRHARRRSLEASAPVARLCRDDEAAVEAVLKSVCRRARESGILAVVPSAVIAALPVCLQTQFLVANSISYETWGRIRRLMGGSLSGLASAPAMRADGKAAFSEPRNRVTSTPVGATLVSLRVALEALVEDLVARNQFIERPVAGRPAGEILLAFGLDKGGRQSSCMAILACINQPHPCSRDNTILFGVFPCQTDNYSALAAMAELYASDLQDLRTNGIMVSGVTRPVHLTLLGDYSFTTSFDGHAGASCRLSCGYCCALARPSAKTIKLIPKYADYGTLQDGSRAARIPRTLAQKAAVAALYANGPLTTLSDPPAVTVTLSIERRPLMLFAPEDIVPMPLHITLGVSPLLLTLGVEAVVFDAGAARAHEYALELTATLRLDVGVPPAP